MDWLKRTQEAFDASSQFIDTNLRADWDYSLKAFRNEHASGSKYLSEEYKSRSRLFRPKTRSIIRKNEAAGAVALFSNMEVTNVTPNNPDDPMSVASAECMKEILEYRLSKTIPAFPLVMGAIQDAQTTGIVCSYQYWDYRKVGDKVVVDKPCIELRPIENIRIDGAASWIDPVNTSPYFADIIPMYVCDVKARMKSKNSKTGEPDWKKYDDAIILKAKPDKLDTTKKARLGKVEDPETETTGISDYDTVWVMRWFMKDDEGKDFTYYSLGTEKLLTDPKPIEEVYFHGKRPYVMGYAILETHKVMKSGVPMLVKPLQQETNNLGNARLDNVNLVLYKRWFVARGRQVDVQSLVRAAPGAVTLMTDPNNDVKESNWPDVTSSAYVEQDRINADIDDLAGNFTPSTKVANNAVNDTLGGSRMAAQGAGLMTDYLIRTIIETWWEPVLRQLVLLEQYYETDEIVLAICAQKARLFPRFGLSQITDDLLMKEVNITVNVGMGAGNPNERFQKFLMALQAATQVVATAPPSLNVQEALKEIFSNAGYRDGARFFNQQVDPRLLQAQKTIQQLQGLVQGKQIEQQGLAAITKIKTDSAERIKGRELQVDAGRIQGDLHIRDTENAIKGAEVNLERMRLAMEQSGADKEQLSQLMEIQSNLKLASMKLQEQGLKNHGALLKIAAESQKLNEERVAA